MRNATLRELLLSLRHNGISDPRVLDAIAQTPREAFISDPALQAHAYADEALPIECEQTITQPFVVAFMSERLHLTREMDVLEIGTGSGYQAAILSRLARSVYTIESHVELHRLAARRFEELGLSNIT
ncbi:MAG: protein-L-isoaspartate O-methyltransferase, partial [Rhodomicrobium sp.]